MLQYLLLEKIQTCRGTYCTEDEIAEGIRHMAWSEKMLVEGSAGLAQAAWQLDAPNRTNKVSAVVLCGANFDRDQIAPIISSIP